MTCRICGAAMRSRVVGWTWYCGRCRHWQADLQPDFEHGTATFHEEFAGREDDCDFLWGVRKKNFERILSTLRRSRPELKTILDIGCATGQFLVVARQHGYAAAGVEPFPDFAAAAERRGALVYRGLFPDAIPASATYDAIIFNDVLEHIPDPVAILRDCAARLNPGGVLVVNGPFREGVFFRIGAAAARMGFILPWERLWQKQYYTPHLHYFSATSIRMTLASAGFAGEAPVRLRTLAVNGTWKRVKSDPAMSTPLKLAVTAAVLLAMPFLALLPADVGFVVAQPHGAR